MEWVFVLIKLDLECPEIIGVTLDRRRVTEWVKEDPKMNSYYRMQLGRRYESTPVPETLK